MTRPDLATDVSADEEGRKTYYPNTEKLGKNEMRVISLGTGMPNQRKSQASATYTKNRFRRNSEKNGGSVHGAQQHVQPPKREKPDHERRKFSDMD